MERLDRPCNILKACRLAAFLGVIVNVGHDILSIHDANLLYNSLLFVIGTMAWVSISLAKKSPSDALQAFAWVGGTAFAFMIFYDAINGDEWLHAYLLYLFGIISLAIHASQTATRRFAIYAACIGFIAGFLYDTADYAVWTALSALFTLGVALYIAPRLHTHDELESIFRTCRDAERGRAAKER